MRLLSNSHPNTQHTHTRSASLWGIFPGETRGSSPTGIEPGRVGCTPAALTTRAKLGSHGASNRTPEGGHRRHEGSGQNNNDQLIAPANQNTPVAAPAHFATGGGRGDRPRQQPRQLPPSLEVTTCVYKTLLSLTFATMQLQGTTLGR